MSLTPEQIAKEREAFEKHYYADRTQDDGYSQQESAWFARAEIAAAEREQRQSEQVAWLIEFGTTPTYWQGWHAQAGMSPNAALFWTSNPHEAVRFSRREDASRVIAILGLSGAPVEHMFIDAILAPREKGGV